MDLLSLVARQHYGGATKWEKILSKPDDLSYLLIKENIHCNLYFPFLNAFTTMIKPDSTFLNAFTTVIKPKSNRVRVWKNIKTGMTN